MKSLVLRDNTFELLRVPLDKPMLVVGRSPTCDVVFRAKGIAPFHYIVELLEEEVPEEDRQWVILDVSSHASTTKEAEGVLLSAKEVVFQNYSFSIVEDKLSSPQLSGGQISQSLKNEEGLDEHYGRKVVEHVHYLAGSQAIQNVSHYKDSSRLRKNLAQSQINHFSLNWDPQTSILEILKEELPGVIVKKQGKIIEDSKLISVENNELLSISYQGTVSYLRLVPEIIVPPSPKRKSSLSSSLSTIALFSVCLVALYMLFFFEYVPPADEEELEKKVVKVKVYKKQPSKKELAPPELPAKDKKTESPMSKEPLVKQAKAPAPKTKTAKKVASSPSGKVAKKRGATLPQYKPAPKKDINSLGLLGALGKPKGPGIRADKILKNARVSDSLSSQKPSDTIVYNSTTGKIGTGTRGGYTNSRAGFSGAGSKIAGADTGTGRAGPITRRGGGVGSGLGSGFGGTGAGVGGGSGSGIGGLGGDSFSVAGGLDKETVRRITYSFKWQRLRCYERFLLKNKNLAGVIRYKWVISPSGPVQSTTLLSNSTGSSSLASCVNQSIRSMKFPIAPNGQATIVTFPFDFRSL